MNEATTTRSAPLVRFFGWAMLATMVAYLVSNYLSIKFGWSGAAALLSNEFSKESLIQAGLFALGLLIPFLFVVSSSHRALRDDAATIDRFNAWLVRGFFWAIVFIGVADMAISFLRVEGLLDWFFSDEMIKQLGRPQWRGAYVHMPLLVAGMLFALVTRTLGFHWLALLIVIAELTIVFTRFVFSYEQAFMGDLVRLWYAALFLFASAYTLLHDGHVRVDVLYAGMKSTSRGAVNAIGALVFGISLCWTIIVIGFKGKASIIYGPIANFEVSQSGFGMYTKYLMAGFLGVFAITMMIQFVSQLFEAWADLRGDPGGKQNEPELESDQQPAH